MRPDVLETSLAEHERVLADAIVDVATELRLADPTEFILLVRGEPTHADQWLVNRLLSQMQPHDFVARYIFDKQGFYQAYEAYSEKFREYVVKTLESTYLKDKVDYRRRLYGIKEE